MWIIIKVDKKKLYFFKNELQKRIDKNTIFYSPKILVSKFMKNKLHNKQISLLGEYMFCFNEKFSKNSIFNIFKYTKGLKEVLKGHFYAQHEIKDFIEKCKNLENEKGYITKNFNQIYENLEYRFSSGLFTNKIFKLIEIQKNKIQILLGDLNLSLNRNKTTFDRV